MHAPLQAGNACTLQMPLEFNSRMLLAAAAVLTSALALLAHRRSTTDDPDMTREIAPTFMST